MVLPSLYPPPLKKGDTLTVIAPAGQLQEPEIFAKGVSLLEEMGFSVKYPRDLWPGNDYLADSDKNRAREFNTFINDPDTAGIISMRGGFGCLRMLDQIDLRQIAAHPKPILGFSDISILHNYLHTRTGLVCFHGPVLTSLPTLTSPALERLYRSLTGQWGAPIDTRQVEILRDGPSSSGRLLGGNLTSLVTLLGTPYDFSWEDAVIFLEDINEPPYRIDRMLTQLFLAGKFDKLSGLILGDFSLSSHEDYLDKIRYKEQVWMRILETTWASNFPIWANIPFGHCPDNFTLPLGATVEMDRKTTRLLFH
ncbi:S66 peptidase family protein [Desulfomarina sp.]